MNTFIQNSEERRKKSALSKIIINFCGHFADEDVAKLFYGLLELQSQGKIEMLQEKVLDCTPIVIKKK